MFGFGEGFSAALPDSVSTPIHMLPESTDPDERHRHGGSSLCMEEKQR